MTREGFEADYSNSIGPTRGIYRGRQQVRELWRSFVEAWREVCWDPEEVIDVDETRVIAVNNVRMRGRGSGLEVETRVAHVWTISDGRAESVKLYQSKDEALEAVGLRE